MCVTENYSIEEKVDKRWDEEKGLKKGSMTGSLVTIGISNPQWFFPPLLPPLPFFEIGSNIAQTGLKLTVVAGLVLNS